MASTTPVGVLTRPRLEEREAEEIVARLYRRSGVVTRLASERDQNFLVADDEGCHFVLKIANRAEDPAVLALQNDVLRRLTASGVPCPVPVSTASGDDVASVSCADGVHLVRLVTYVPGRPLSSVASHGLELLRQVGSLAGSLSEALSGFDHPAARRPFQWAMQRSPSIVATCLSLVEAEPRRHLLEGLLARLRTNLEPVFPALRWSVVHNDANDDNVLVDDAGSRVVGIIDVGDVVYAPTASEVAVASAYAMLDEDEPLSAAAAVVSGYHRVFPLTVDELDVLFDLIRARLATSVALSAYQTKLEPGDPYLSVSERSAWELLERLEGVEPEAAALVFRDACATA